MAAVAAMPASEKSPSIFCACCRSNSNKKKALPQSQINRVLQPTVSGGSFPISPLSTNDQTVPRIVIENGVKEVSVDTCRTTKSEAYYVTARTSRADEFNNYASMSELVRQIRTEAGLSNTPRPNEHNANHVVTEMRIEGLPDIQKRNYHASPLTRISELEEGSVHSEPLEIRCANSITGEPEENSIAKHSFFGRISSVPHTIICLVSIVYLYCTSFLAAVFDKII